MIFSIHHIGLGTLIVTPLVTIFGTLSTPGLKSKVKVSNIDFLIGLLIGASNMYTHTKRRVDVTPEVELFPYILDNTR